MFSKNLKFISKKFTKHIILLLIYLIHNYSYSNNTNEENNYTIYEVKKYDTIETILKRNKLYPIYGNNGYLEKFFELNPNKRRSKFHIIYQKEKIKIPIFKPIQSNDTNNINNFSSSIFQETNNKEVKNLNLLPDLPNDHVYIIYTVKRDDMISKLLQKHGTTPIYGQKGYLIKTLELNPRKKPEMGDLIYPHEEIILPVKIDVLLKIANEEGIKYKILKNKFFKKGQNNEQIPFEEFEKKYRQNDNENQTTLKDTNKLSSNQVYIVYKVKKDDMISKLLLKFGATPIYIKNGYLEKTLELNPSKKNTKGDLIYPYEEIILPVKIDVLLKIINEEGIEYTILKNAPLKKGPNNESYSNEDSASSDEEKLESSNKEKIKDPNESILSHDEVSVPSTLKITTAVRYLTLNQFNTNNDRHAALYSAASPSISLDLMQNWEDNLTSYFGISDLYIDIMKSPIYFIKNRQFHLLSIHAGVEYTTNFNLYFQNELTTGQDLVYESEGYNTMEDHIIYIMNNKMLVGYTFFQFNNLKAQAEAAYIITVPLYKAQFHLGNGYSGAVKVRQQNSGFALATGIFYTDRMTYSESVQSNVIEFGIIGVLSLELGYL